MLSRNEIDPKCGVKAVDLQQARELSVYNFPGTSGSSSVIRLG